MAACGQSGSQPAPLPLPPTSSSLLQWLQQAGGGRTNSQTHGALTAQLEHLSPLTASMHQGIGWDYQGLLLPLPAAYLLTMVTWLVPLCLVCGSSQLENKLNSQDKTVAKPPSRWKPEKACEDLYDRYCSVLTPDKCYLSYNRKLCCATCTTFSSLHSANTEEDACPYGNRDRNCDRMDTNKCYTATYRHGCCGKCASVYTNMPECRYGDKDVHTCSKIKPYHCYKEDVRQVCCGTCAKHYTARSGCEYGDHVKLITRSRRKYNCAAYTAHFGYARCKLPWEKSFQEGCCGSCYDAFNGDKMRRYPYYFNKY